jgi:hypothetical protein
MGRTRVAGLILAGIALLGILILVVLFRRGEQVLAGRVWGAAKWRPRIIHLLPGMNAHLNFHLGIGPAQACPEDQLPGLKSCAHNTNRVLAGLLKQV